MTSTLFLWNFDLILSEEQLWKGGVINALYLLFILSPASVIWLSPSLISSLFFILSHVFCHKFVVYFSDAGCSAIVHSNIIVPVCSVIKTNIVNMCWNLRLICIVSTMFWLFFVQESRKWEELGIERVRVEACWRFISSRVSQSAGY